jgi:TPR repeat protein
MSPGGGTETALAEGLFWYAEKLHYGYEGVEQNLEEALGLYRQAAELGYPRAFLRIGEMHERGLGTPMDPSQALACYVKAREAGHIIGLAAMARLIGRSQHREKSEALWAKFFATLANYAEHDLGVDEPAASIHSYLFWKIARGQEPRLYAGMRGHGRDVIGYSQRYMEHAEGETQFDILQKVQRWALINLMSQ